MAKKILLFTFISIFSLYSFCQPAKSELKGIELSEKVEELLYSEGLYPMRQNLTKTGSNAFPFNIILTFTASETALNDTIIIAFTQEEFIKHNNAVLNFLNRIEKIRRKCNIQILLSCGDKNILSGNEETEGSKVFASSIEESENTAGIFLQFAQNSSEKNVVYPGAKGSTSPSYLVRKIQESFAESGITVSIPTLTLPLYRLGFLDGEKRMQSFISEDIPSVLIEFGNEGSIFGVEKLIENYKDISKEDWDKHYSFVFGKIFLPEKFYVILFIVISGTALFLIFGFSFIGKDHHIRRKEFLRHLYLIPVLIAISLASLILAQLIVTSTPFLEKTPLLFQWTFKIAFSAIFITAIFVFHERKVGSIKPQIMGYLSVLVAALNIFIFSAIDLSFIFLFLFEYSIIYIFQHTKKRKWILTAMIVCTIPFIPYGQLIVSQNNSIEIKNFVTCTPVMNLLQSIVLFPFQIFYFRFLNAMKILRKHKKLKIRSILFRTSLSTVSLISALSIGILLIFAATKIFQSNIGEKVANFIIFSPRSKPEIKLTEDEADDFQIFIQEEQQIGLNNQILRIKSEKQSLRYTISAIGQNGIPLYDSDFNYDLFEDEKKAVFIIPDNPPNDFTINFISNESFRITVQAYFEKENDLNDRNSILITEEKFESDWQERN